MGFDLLHPAVQHHVVNTLGWRTLRPLQNEAIDPLIQGKHALLLAPTASGKTEAAILPLMSRMLNENWTGLTIVYLCPIKALLNNLHGRLNSFMQLMGRTVGVWHGDVSTAERKKLLRNPPDCLLSTPESLELMLVSSTTDERALFAHLRAVVVDEIHAFAGDDRGWHLVCLLSRLSKIALKPIQRIGLSATVGNPQELVDWLASRSPGERVVVNPPASGLAPPQITLDYVGSIENAAFVISQLHRGEKRLVFCDSRSRAEHLAAQLRELKISTFVSHSSLSIDERRQAEAAFATGSDCVIVATSTLELGIDVGDLDRVIQLDAPSTVKSFLQRLGRTGRRAGTTRNCLFLATSPAALMHAAGLIELWRSGYVEPTTPPPKPFHVLAQQLMALALQEQGIPRYEWIKWLSETSELADTPPNVLDAICDSLIEKDILWDDQGVLWFGARGQKELGYRAFSKLLSVFTAEPLLKAMHGRNEIGLLHPLCILRWEMEEQPSPVSLGGRGWDICEIDWDHNIVQVKPSPVFGRSIWHGGAIALSEPMCRSVRTVITNDAVPSEWSKRAVEGMTEIREAQKSLRRIQLTEDGLGRSIWWTFVGLRANAQLAHALHIESGYTCTPGNHQIEIKGVVTYKELEAVLALPSPLPLPEQLITQYLASLKFGSYLPAKLQTEMIEARLQDETAIDVLRKKGV